MPQKLKTDVAVFHLAPGLPRQSALRQHVIKPSDSIVIQITRQAGTVRSQIAQGDLPLAPGRYLESTVAGGQRVFGSNRQSSALHNGGNPLSDVRGLSRRCQVAVYCLNNFRTERQLQRFAFFDLNRPNFTREAEDRKSTRLNSSH